MRTENRCMWPGKQASSSVSLSITPLSPIPNLPLQLTLLIPLSLSELPLLFQTLLISAFCSLWFLSFLSPLLLHLQPLFCLSTSLLCPGHLKGKRNSQKSPSSKVFHFICSCGKARDRYSFDSCVLKVQLLIFILGQLIQALWAFRVGETNGKQVFVNGSLHAVQ